MAASVTSYVIFISFIVMIVGPGLFALSFQLLTIVSGFAAKMGASTGASSSMPIKFSSVSIDPQDFISFSRLSIGTISAFSAMILSIISRGDIKSGIKYIPVFVIIGLVNHWIFMKVLSGMFKFILV